MAYLSGITLIDYIGNYLVRIIIRNLTGPHLGMTAASILQHYGANINLSATVNNAVANGNCAILLVFAIHNPNRDVLFRI